MGSVCRGVSPAASGAASLAKGMTSSGGGGGGACSASGGGVSFITVPQAGQIVSLPARLLANQRIFPHCGQRVVKTMRCRRHCKRDQRRGKRVAGKGTAAEKYRTLVGSPFPKLEMIEVVVQLNSPRKSLFLDFGRPL